MQCGSWTLIKLIFFFNHSAVHTQTPEWCSTALKCIATIFSLKRSEPRRCISVPTVERTNFSLFGPGPVVPPASSRSSLLSLCVWKHSTSKPLHLSAHGAGILNIHNQRRSADGSATHRQGSSRTTTTIHHRSDLQRRWMIRHGKQGNNTAHYLTLLGE